jgi:hypothetical protein
LCSTFGFCPDKRFGRPLGTTRRPHRPTFGYHATNCMVIFARPSGSAPMAEYLLSALLSPRLISYRKVASGSHRGHHHSAPGPVLDDQTC